jgi:anthranilate synthase
MESNCYRTKGGITVHRDVETLVYPYDITSFARTLDRHRGVLFSSGYEYPGRYTRWDKCFVNPPLMLAARGRRFSVTALNPRGEVLLRPIARQLNGLATIVGLHEQSTSIEGEVCAPTARFPEEQRSR